MRRWPTEAVAAKSARAARDGVGVHAPQQPGRLGPCLLRGVAGDDVEADAELERPVAGGPRRGRGPLPHPLQPLAGRVGRFSPQQVRVDVGRGDRLGRVGRATEEDRRRLDGGVAGGGGLDPVEVAVEVERGRPESAAQHGEELSRTAVALVLGEVVAEAGQLGGLGADHDVDHQPSTRHGLVGGGHLRGLRRVEEPGRNATRNRSAG
jgi:hypothetical protein